MFKIKFVFIIIFLYLNANASLVDFSIICTNNLNKASCEIVNNSASFLKINNRSVKSNESQNCNESYCVWDTRFSHSVLNVGLNHFEFSVRTATSKIDLDIDQTYNFVLNNNSISEMRSVRKGGKVFNSSWQEYLNLEQIDPELYLELQNLNLELAQAFKNMIDLENDYQKQIHDLEEQIKLKQVELEEIFNQLKSKDLLNQDNQALKKLNINFARLEQLQERLNTLNMNITDSNRSFYQFDKALNNRVIGVNEKLKKYSGAVKLVEKFNKLELQVADLPPDNKLSSLASSLIKSIEALHLQIDSSIKNENSLEITRLAKAWFATKVFILEQLHASNKLSLAEKVKISGKLIETAESIEKNIDSDFWYNPNSISDNTKNIIDTFVEQKIENASALKYKLQFSKLEPNNRAHLEISIAKANDLYQAKVVDVNPELIANKEKIKQAVVEEGLAQINESVNAPNIFDALKAVNQMFDAAKTMAVTSLDFVPVVSEAKGIYELLTGKDLLGNELASSERIFSGAAVLASLVPVPGAKVYAKNTLKKSFDFLRKLQKHKLLRAFKQEEKVLETIHGFYNLSDDILENISFQKILEIRKIQHGFRPRPETYLSKEYIKMHSNAFSKGATRIAILTGDLTLENFKSKWKPRKNIFVLPTSEFDLILQKAKGNSKYLEDTLGFPNGYLLGKEIVRIDIPNPVQFKIQIPNGNEYSANDLWIPGGKTIGNHFEAVLDDLTSSDFTVKKI